MKAQGNQRKFYNSQTWKRTRKAYGDSKQWLCERCLKHGQITKGIIVHHKIKLNENNIKNYNISLSFDNLELVCRACHASDEYMEHGTGKRRFIFVGDKVLPKCERSEVKDIPPPVKKQRIH